MLRFLFCLLYLAVLGLLCFPFGRMLARKTYDPARWPFRPWRFETDGHFYGTIKIKKWERKVPDIGKFEPHIVPEKRVAGRMTAGMCAGMINETCVAEITHTERHRVMFQPGHRARRILDLGVGRLAAHIRDGGFDAAVCTHVFADAMLTDAVRRHGLRVTPGVEASDLDWYFVPSPAHRLTLGELGVP